MVKESTEYKYCLLSTGESCLFGKCPVKQERLETENQLFIALMRKKLRAGTVA